MSQTAECAINHRILNQAHHVLCLAVVTEMGALIGWTAGTPPQIVSAALWIALLMVAATVAITTRRLSKPPACSDRRIAKWSRSLLLLGLIVVGWGAVTILLVSWSKP